MISTSYKAKDTTNDMETTKVKGTRTPRHPEVSLQDATLVSVHGSPLGLALLSPVVDSALGKVGGNALGHALPLVGGRLFGLDLGKVPGQTARIAHAELDLASEGAEGELIPASALASFARVQSFRRLEQRSVSEKDDSAAVDDVSLHARRVKVLLDVLSLDNVVVNVSPDLQNLVSGVVLQAVLAEGLAAARDAEEGAVVLLRVPVLLAHVKVVVADELEEPSAGGKREGNGSQTQYVSFTGARAQRLRAWERTGDSPFSLFRS